MNAEFRRAPFATRASDAFGKAATQSLEEEQVAEKFVKGKSVRSRRPAEPRLSSIPRSQLPDADLLDIIEPRRTAADLVVSPENFSILSEVVDEVRRGEELRRYGLSPRSKLLFCGPPGCGKTLCAEVVARELKLPLITLRLDGVITTYLGGTATNLRKTFDLSSRFPAVLFLDEFDALARSREDANEHNEIRRVVNSLLMLIDSFSNKGMLIAATNLESSIDRAVWRRFDEVVLFDKPSIHQIKTTLKLKTRNFPPDFDITAYADQLDGMSFAEIERVCLNAIRRSILERRSEMRKDTFERSVTSELRRITIRKKIS